MPDIPKPQGDVLRRNAEHECGTPIGQVNVAVKGLPGFQTISFYCNQPRLHADECVFNGAQIVVRANHRGIQLAGKIGRPLA
jgi:hypothetical protein